MSASAISRQSSTRPSMWLPVHVATNLCRDSTKAGSNLFKLSVTDGFFWRSEIPSVTVIGPTTSAL
jgi:hypothetical protein